MQKLSHNDHIDLYRHLSFCAVGGFFGCYAVLIHSGVMGNAQTVNLIELLLDALRGNRPQPAPAGGGQPGPAPSIIYNPTYQFYGGTPSKEDLVEAGRISQEEFNEMMDKWKRDHDRTDF